MRPSIPAALAALALALPAALIGGAPARAAAVYLEANPDTVAAGGEVGLRASCDDNLRAATVTGAPLPDTPVRPRYGLLTATARVPAATRPGTYTLTLACPEGTKATTRLYVVARVAPQRGPATGGGGTASGPAGPLLVGVGLLVLAGGGVLGLVAARRRRAG